MKKRNKIIIFISILVICYTVFSLISFVGADITPATTKDYEELEQIAHDLTLSNVDFSKLTSFSTKLENKECIIIVTYDNNYEILKIERNDKADSLFGLIIVVIIVGSYNGVLIYSLILILIKFILSKKEGHI